MTVAKSLSAEETSRSSLHLVFRSCCSLEATTDPRVGLLPLRPPGVRRLADRRSFRYWRAYSYASCPAVSPESLMACTITRSTDGVSRSALRLGPRCLFRECSGKSALGRTFGIVSAACPADGKSTAGPADDGLTPWSFLLGLLTTIGTAASFRVFTALMYGESTYSARQSNLLNLHRLAPYRSVVWFNYIQSRSHCSF
jgi:hypothetical protein